MTFRAWTMVGLAILATAPAGAAAQQGWRVRTEPPAWLGIGYEIGWIQESSMCEPQVWVERVMQGSPAERAGLRVGDAIVALDDQPLPAARLQAVAGRLHPGDSLRFRVDRNGQLRDLTAVAERRPARPPAPLAASEPGFMGATSAPVVRLDGSTLVARNIESGSQGSRGYWLATDDGRTEYRRLDSWSRNDLDERVVRLLRCADEAGTRAAMVPRGVDLQQLQRRADSLRVVITRRTLAPTPAAGQPPHPPEPYHPTALPGRAPEINGTGSSTYILRMEDHLAAELRGVAGAEITTLEPELAAYFRNVDEGLLVLRIARGSVADHAGLQPGDVIVEGDGRGLRSPGELRALLSRPNPQDVQLRVVRKGRSRLLSLPRS